MTHAQVAEALEVSQSTISRVETGRSGCRPKFVRELLDLYGVHDPELREELQQLAREGKKQGWWSSHYGTITDSYSTYIGLGAEAGQLLVYNAMIIDGLLQTEDYARSVIKADAFDQSEQIREQKVKVRMERQQVLNKDRPLEFWGIFSESAIRTVIGGPAIMRNQLKRLLDLADLPNMTLQVVPFSGGAFPGLVGSFTVIKFPAPDDPNVVYAEGLTGDVWAEGGEAERYSVVFDHLRAAALSPAKTIDLIEDVREELRDS